MSAYTALADDALAALLEGYAVGAPLRWQAIHDGIKNSNYRLATEAGEYVLTLFESLTAGALPPYLAVMDGLAGHGLPCPRPVPDRAGRALGQLLGKPAMLAATLPGASIAAPTSRHCYAIGAALAVVHGVGRQLPPLAANPCGPAWWQKTTDALRPHLDRDSTALLADELAFQGRQNRSALPSGLVHGDLFRDNALFEDGRLSGLLDWYEACHEAWLYDLAVAANDWCVDAEGGLRPNAYAALLDGYAGVRPLTAAEQDALPAMLRAAALRFWLSRLQTRQVPRPGHLVQDRDPDEFKRILLRRRAMESTPVG